MYIIAIILSFLQTGEKFLKKNEITGCKFEHVRIVPGNLMSDRGHDLQKDWLKKSTSEADGR
jgi:hypothetical protein